MNQKQELEMFIEAIQAYLAGKQLRAFTSTGTLVGIFSLEMDERIPTGKRVFDNNLVYKIVQPKVLRPWKYEEIPTGAVVRGGSMEAEAVIVRKFPAASKQKHPTVRLGGYGNTSISTLTLLNQYLLVNRLCSSEVELKECGVWEEQP